MKLALQELALVAAKSIGLPFDELVEAAIATLMRDGKLIFFGNGGSMAEAMHIAAEFTIRFRKNRQPFAAIALADPCALTAAGNDLSFDEVFGRQIGAIGREGDLAIALTTSGRSLNVLGALAVCRQMGITTVALTSAQAGQRILGLSDIILAVPSTSTARIQEMHLLIGHSLVEAVEDKLLACGMQNCTVAV